MVEYTYDAWGNILKEKSNVTPSYATVKEFNPFRYRGYVYDTDTGLYYLQSRYYDPKTGRFINADDTAYVDTNSGTPLSTNMFAYCENNHINETDIDGYKTVIKAWHFKYNRTKAVSYAKKWFNSFNPEYYKYRYDCTNFVSQCLYAGGIPMSFGSDSYTWHSFRSTKWFFSPLGYISNNARYNWDVSAAWRLCAINYSYFKKSVYAKRVFVIKDTRNSVRASINKLKIGDLLYMDDDGDGVPNHAVIISSINRKKKKIYYAAHTNPHKKKDLEEYLKHRKHSKKKVLAIHIIDSF